jgi:CRP/FNR family transcriptional regulator, dissimilatory nitrate respiration regulator
LIFNSTEPKAIAAEMGTTNETLSRTLAKFRDRKLLSVKGNTVVVTRPRELEELLRRHLGEL